MKKFLLAFLLCTTLTNSALLAADSAPKTVIHVITVKWKADAKPEQIEKALAEVAKLPATNAGVTRTWTKPIKKQLPEGFNHVIVMEFASEDALQKYVDSPAQKKFYDVYMPLREASRTSDITN